MGAKAMGVEFGAEGYGVREFASSAWIMALNGVGWLMVVGLFADKLNLFQEKITGGNTALIGKIGTGAIIGASSFIVASQLIIERQVVKPNLVAVLASSVLMFVLTKISEKLPKLKEWNLGISMFVAMFIAALF